MGCLCLTEPAVDYVSQQLIALEKCEVRETAAKPLADAVLKHGALPESAAWWARPSVVIGGVVVSFSLGLAVGYWLTR